MSQAELAEVSVLFFRHTDHFQKPLHIVKNSGAIQETLVYHGDLSPLGLLKLKQKALREYINENGMPDIMHVHVLSADLILFTRFALKNNIPYFITDHWSGYTDERFSALPRIKQLLYKRMARKASGIFPVSEFLKKVMLNCGLKGTYHVVPNVIDTVQKTVEKHPVYTYIVVADFVESTKNISGIVKAFQELRKQTEARLVLVGDGPDYNKIKKVVDAQPEDIEFKGRLENESALMEISKSHCLIVNSNVETFSVVLLEARAKGLWAIATKCGGPEGLADQNTLLIPKNSGRELLNAMHTVKKNPVASVRNIDEFRSKSIGSKLIEYYKKALSV